MAGPCRVGVTWVLAREESSRLHPPRVHEVVVRPRGAVELASAGGEQPTGQGDDPLSCDDLLRHAAGMPDAPHRAPASWPAIAAVVSASSPRFAARSTALRKSSAPATDHSAASSASMQ